MGTMISLRERIGTKSCAFPVMYSLKSSPLTECLSRGRYHLAFPDKRNHFTLRKKGKGPDFPLVAEIKTGTLASYFEIAMANGWTTSMRWPAVLAGNFDFLGPDSVSKYRWKSIGRVSMDFTRASSRPGSRSSSGSGFKFRAAELTLPHYSSDQLGE